jgi:hypothetical protein
MAWWDERGAPAPPVCILDALPAALLTRALALLAPSPPDVAAAASVCTAFRDALRGARLTRREWACAACGAPAFDSDAMQPQQRVRWAFLHDGPALTLDARAALAGALRAAARGARVCEAHRFMQRERAHIHGVRLAPEEEARGATAARSVRLRQPAQPVVCEALACARCSLYLGACCTFGGVAWAAVTEAYVRRRLVGGAPDPAPVPTRVAAALLRCAGTHPDTGAPCGALLGRLEDVLSKEHVWLWDDPPPPPPHAQPQHAAPFAPLEYAERLDAWCLNHLAPGAVTLSHRREEALSQGTFEVEDAACGACGARVGWRFGAYRVRGPAYGLIGPALQAGAAATHPNVRTTLRCASVRLGCLRLRCRLNQRVCAHAIERRWAATAWWCPPSAWSRCRRRDAMA